MDGTSIIPRKFKKRLQFLTIFDIEVEKNYKDFSYKPEPWELGFGCAVVWDRAKDAYLFFDRKDELIRYLYNSPFVIGHNILRFDIPLLLGRYSEPSFEQYIAFLPEFPHTAFLDTLILLAGRKSQKGPDEILRNPQAFRGLSLDSIGSQLGRHKFNLIWDQDHSNFKWGNPRYMFQRGLQDVRIIKKLLQWGGLMDV